MTNEVASVSSARVGIHYLGSGCGMHGATRFNSQRAVRRPDRDRAGIRCSQHLGSGGHGDIGECGAVRARIGWGRL